MTVRTLHRSFAGGEITPELFGRIDMGKYHTGLALCKNFLPLPHGPVRRRRGTTYVNRTASQTRDHPVRLIPFAFSSTQTMVLELSNKQMRFHTMNGTVRSGGSPLTLVTPWTWVDVFDLHYAQSADKITFVHPSYNVYELQRLGAGNWSLVKLEASHFQSRVTSPSSITATNLYGKTPGTDAIDYLYQVTGVFGAEESEPKPSTPAVVSSELWKEGWAVQVSWSQPSAPSGQRLPDYYNVYKREGGMMGFVGRAMGTSFVDDNIRPDTLTTPSRDDNNYGSSSANYGYGTSTNNYPSAVTYFEQRRWFAGTNNQPQTIKTTRTGTDHLFTSSVPIQADDSFTFSLASMQQDRIRHLIPLNSLIALTAGGVWLVDSMGDNAITPSSIRARPHSYVGANNVQPVVTAESILYVQNTGSRIREITFNGDTRTLQSLDLTIMAPHLFERRRVVDIAFQQSPYPILWVVRDDGIVLTLTYMADQQVAAWAQHDFGGTVESVCVVTEDNVDVVYLTVYRNGIGRCVERLSPDEIVDTVPWTERYYVDCGIATSFFSGPVTTVSGLDWLKGQTVKVVTDNALHPDRVVDSNGEITLDHPARLLVIGLGNSASIETLPLTLEGAPAGGQGIKKHVTQVNFRLRNSTQVLAGPTGGRMTLMRPRNVTDPYNKAPSLVEGEIDLVIAPNWNTDGGVCVQSVEPMPLQILSMTLEVQTGG